MGKGTRDISIDLLKCLAAFLITNSHMGKLYGDYIYLATGGCIGDALFFFCSGFTLFFKPMNGIKEFPNWFKKRIRRIYPSVIAVAFMGCVFFNQHWDVIDLLLLCGYWFLQCIMIYYVAIFFIGSYAKDKIIHISIAIAIGTAIWFFNVCEEGFWFYGGHYIRWLLYFIFMLFGAKLGTLTEKIKYKPFFDFIMLLLCIALFYLLYILGLRSKSLMTLQLLSAIPLLGSMYYFYKVGGAKLATNYIKVKWGQLSNL